MAGSLPVNLTARIERFPIANAFTIARGSKTEAVVVVAEVSDGIHIGRGECVPYPRYNETPDGTLAEVNAMAERLRLGLDRRALQSAMPAGAARNALDCALWDFAAKRAGRRVWDLIGRAPPAPLTTAYTISLGSPEAMAVETAKASHRPLLKVKLGGEGDEQRIQAVRRAAPNCELVVDANESWSPDNIARNLAACAAQGVTLIEQPLPAGHDEMLAAIKRPVAVCADESVHDRASLAVLRGKYDAVNIKLDKTGGLTEALAMFDAAQKLGLRTMAGCMVATSLSMAPAIVLAQGADVVDLDGALLLARDREHGLRYDGSVVHPPEAALWG
jgi:L-alanine-DL-glutamate epimerase-like enolase superfamily enzyme